MKKFLLLLILMVSAGHIRAQDRALYEKQLFIVNEDTLRCRILTPFNFKPHIKYPLVVFMHGSGERGDDNESQLVWGGDLFLDSLNRSKYPAIVVFPQCPKGEQWATYIHDKDKDSTRMVFYPDSPVTRSMKMVLNFIDTLVAAGTVDNKRIYVGGLSMGGIGTFNILYRRPDLFAAGIAICGAGDPSMVKQYRKNLPLWVFHGSNDSSVPVTNSRLMVNTLKKVDPYVKYTEYAGVGHDSWKNAFAEKELLPWLFAQKK